MTCGDAPANLSLDFDRPRSRVEAYRPPL